MLASTDMISHSMEVAAAINDFIEAMYRALTTHANPSERPKVLYHFTDLSSLVGILSSRVLWASLATALNDPTEVLYGIQRARLLIRSSWGEKDRQFFDRVESLLEPTNWLPAYRMEFRPYVISFCARSDLALQWLHYGRSGEGCVIGFDSALERKDLDLFRVIYAPTEQDEFLRRLIDAVFTSMGSRLPTTPSEEREKVSTIAAHIIAQAIWAAAPQLKNPAFEAEAEWRLFMLDMFGERVPTGPNQPPPTQFRTVGARVVPYKSCAFSPDLIGEIILGHMVPLPVDDHGLRVLMRDGLGRIVPTSRSAVPVRK